MKPSKEYVNASLAKDRTSFPSGELVSADMEIIEDVSPSSSMDIVTLVPSQLLREGDENGWQIRELARNQGEDLGLVDGDYIVKHQDQVPRSWRGHEFILPGTLVLCKNRGFDLPVLAEDNDGRWKIDFRWVPDGVRWWWRDQWRGVYVLKRASKLQAAK